MKAFGYSFNAGMDSDKGGVVFDKTIEEAISQIKQEIEKEYISIELKKALGSLQVYDLNLII